MTASTHILIHEDSNIADYFRTQADWRQSKADEYPEDDRNAQSAAALYSLADYIDSGDADAMLLASHCSVDGVLGGEQVKAETIRYGFGYNATTPSQHDEMLCDLWLAAMADAYALATELGDGGDWTGSLWSCEVQAAIDENPRQLPEAYWRRRSVEHEAEQLLAMYQQPVGHTYDGKPVYVPGVAPPVGPLVPEETNGLDSVDIEAAARRFLGTLRRSQVATIRKAEQALLDACGGNRDLAREVQGVVSGMGSDDRLIVGAFGDVTVSPGGVA